MNNANLIGLRLGITEQVGLGGNTVWGGLRYRRETMGVESVGACSAEGQGVFLQMILRGYSCITFFISMAFHCCFM